MQTALRTEFPSDYAQAAMTLVPLQEELTGNLTAVRLYGVISCTVSERTREIGIRAALGASRTDIVRLVLGGSSSRPDSASACWS